MSAPRIAVCLVVTDDARDLHGCLTSLRQLGQLLTDVCVYGAGAPERVLAAARSAGATVQSGPCDGDLSAARNAAACMTQAPWVLVVEPAERVRVDIAALTTLFALSGRLGEEPDAIALEVSAGARGAGGDERARRQERLYRPERAHFAGALEDRLEPLTPGRPLVARDAGADVISLWSVVAHGTPADERARLMRRLQRASATVATLDSEGIGGNDVVTALVERSRASRALGDDEGALSDLRRARRVSAGDSYRWRAREDLATLLIEHGYLDGAKRLIDELRADGADEQYSDWLAALVHSAQGQARQAWEILRRLDSATSSEGRVVATPQIRTEQMHLANRLGEPDEALTCCVDLVATHGRAARHGRMLLKLWGPRCADALADLIIQTDARHLEDIAAALEVLPEPGPSVALRLLAVRAEKPSAVRIM